MEIWLIFGVLGYLSYAISSSIDKYLMNKNYNVLRTTTIKEFFEGAILLIIGLLFFNLDFTFDFFLLTLLLGTLLAFAAISYFRLLKLEDVETAMPVIQSSSLLLAFLCSIILFNEIVTTFDYLGVFLILVGAYIILSKDGIKIPKLGKSAPLILTVVVLITAISLLAKKLLFDIEPINLAIMMYFSATIILVGYQSIFKKRSFKELLSTNTKISKIFVTALFGSIGTFLLFSALAIGAATKVFPLAGTQSVFIFIIATIFLKEKFYWHRLIGTLAVVAGIFIISI